jgi:hypothetical protein
MAYLLSFTFRGSMLRVNLYQLALLLAVLTIAESPSRKLEQRETKAVSERSRQSTDNF